jgi:diadenosine tetraphosphate (Ap4A) HIT family hydrolase
VLRVGRAIEAAFSPVKLNYNVLGNSVPHLHTHIVPRYADDPRPAGRFRSRIAISRWRIAFVRGPILAHHWL